MVTPKWNEGSGGNGIGFGSRNGGRNTRKPQPSLIELMGNGIEASGSASSSGSGARGSQAGQGQG